MKFSISIFVSFFFLLHSEIVLGSELSNLWKPRDQYETRRISSYDSDRSNDDFIRIPSGKEAILMDISGSGVIRHIWITLWSKDKMILRNAILRMYWDDQVYPSVEVPLGDFFGQGWGEEYIMNSLPIVAGPKNGKALNSFFPMPFFSRARITVENQSDEEIGSFYYYIDYEKRGDIPKSSPRFHAFWTRNLARPGTDSDRENDRAVLGKMLPGKPDIHTNHVFVDIEGSGHLVGIQYYVDSPSPLWYGEGDDMIWIDGNAWPPRLHGTGTEDFFLTAWCPKEVFHHPYFGYPRVNQNIGWLGRTHLYRFFLESPIRFNKSLLASIEHGHGNALTLDLVSVAYWYQSLPGKKFPKIATKEKRQNMPPITENDIHRWRDSFRRERGGGFIWGNEK